MERPASLPHPAAAGSGPRTTATEEASNKPKVYRSLCYIFSPIISPFPAQREEIRHEKAFEEKRRHRRCRRGFRHQLLGNQQQQQVSDSADYGRASWVGCCCLLNFIVAGDFGRNFARSGEGSIERLLLLLLLGKRSCTQERMKVFS